MKTVIVISILLLAAAGLFYVNRNREVQSKGLTFATERLADVAGKLVHAVSNTVPSSAPIKIEHGWKTERVMATRRKNDAMGQFVELTYPQNPYDCDRAEISDFIEDRDGWVFQGGGSPGASMFVKFKNVNDASEMDKKLLTVLPALDKLMRDITYGIPIPKSTVKRKIVDKHGKEWPECVPPDPEDPYGAFNNNLSVNGTPYMCSPEGRWVVNQKSQDALNKIVQEQHDLVAAISTRKLTKAELMQLQPSINTFPMQPYFACEKYAELYEMLAKQWELQKGEKLPLYTPLSRALGEYNRCPQEHDNEIAVARLIKQLQENE
jgi:hypothetical protein